MARTISTALRDPSRPSASTYDLDGAVVDGVDALKQRIEQAIKFRFGTWFLARGQGLDYDLLIGHRLPASLAAAALNRVIRTEGGSEVLTLRDVVYSLDQASRVFRYSVMVETIYGPLPIDESLQ